MYLAYFVLDENDGIEKSSSSEDDFIDEFGNIREQVTECSGNEKNITPEANSDIPLIGRRKKRKRGKARALL